MKHLVKDYNIDLTAIKNFNTRKVLSNRKFTYLKNTRKGRKQNRKTRKNRK